MGLISVHAVQIDSVLYDAQHQTNDRRMTRVS